MRAGDVTDTLNPALKASGCDRANVAHRLRLPGDNGTSCISAGPAGWLSVRGMDHVRGTPHHPQTRGRIERRHRTPKNRVLPENHCLPGDPENRIAAFVEHCNNERHHEGTGNVTPADACSGYATAIVERRKRIKEPTVGNRRLKRQRQAAQQQPG